MEYRDPTWSCRPLSTGPGESTSHQLFGEFGCHSDFHQTDRPSPPRRSQTPPPSAARIPTDDPLPQHVRDLFTPWRDYEECFCCGRADCIARLHRHAPPLGSQGDLLSTTTAPIGLSNLSRSSSQGDRTR